jgi:hypothetical protein
MTDPSDDLIDLIIKAVVARYDGDLTRSDEDPRDGSITYRPNDTDHIRRLLTETWGALVKRAVLDDAYDRLTEEGAEHWPQAWCEEDLADERERQLRAIDRQEAEIERWEEELGAELQHLAAAKRALSAACASLFPDQQPPPRINQIDHL